MTEITDARRTHSFFDLRQFAAESLPHRTPSGVRPPREEGFLAHRRRLDLPPGPVSVGAIDLDRGEGYVAAQPADEFLSVCSGTISLEAHDTSVVLHAGQAAVIQQGCAFRWNAHGPASIVFMRYGGGANSAGSIVPIHASPTMQPSSPPAAELLLGPTPKCRSHTDHRSADGVFSCGTWDSTPYQRRAMTYRHHELMCLVKGSVSFQDSAGRRGTFRAGDIVLVEQHAECSWESHEDVVKIYALYKP